MAIVQEVGHTCGYTYVHSNGGAVLLPTILELWVGAYVAEDSVTVGRILCLGVFFNAIGAMFYSFLHAQGRTKITAIFHLIEFPLFIAALYLLITKFECRAPHLLGCYASS